MSYRTPLIAGFIFLVPVIVLAQLVPCDGVRGGALEVCQACHLVTLAQNIVNWLIAIAVFIAVLMFSYAGFLMVTAAGNTGQVDRARTIFKDVAIGFIILLAAWLIVDTVMKTLYNGSVLDESTKANFGVWNEIKCVPQPVGTGAGTGVGAGGAVVPAPTAECPDCVAIDQSVATCKHVESCTVSAAMAENLGELSAYGLRVTEGFPPTYTHQNPCHSNGTCLDITIDNFSPNNIRQFQEDARAAGYRAVYEPSQGESCPSGTDCLEYSVTRSTGRHFSLYPI